MDPIEKFEMYVEPEEEIFLKEVGHPGT